MFEKKQVMECYRGSRAHNLFVPPEEENGTDDIDLINVYVYPIQYYLTLEGYRHKKEVKEEWKGELDIVGYEIKKMFSLLSQINPNVIATFYTRKEDYLFITDQWKKVIENRHIFLGKDRIRDAYCGYARSQLKRMGSGSKNGYMGEKRFKLVEKYGYDCKNAAHSIRLLRMGIEFLRDGEPKVYREHDREELLAIKNGKLKLKEVDKMATDLLNKVDKAHKKSQLPDKNNPIEINKLLFNIMQELVLQ